MPQSVKAEVTAGAREIIETEWKPKYLKPPRKKPRFNYIVDIYSKWHRTFFYFCAKYACPGPNSLSPYFEHKFTRLAYMANGRFNLAYMRHTGRWGEIRFDLSLKEALAAVRSEAIFHPAG